MKSYFNFRFHHQALVEVKILDALRRKDKDNQFNIIHMGEYFYFRNHLCITFELMGYVIYDIVECILLKFNEKLDDRNLHPGVKKEKKKSFWENRSSTCNKRTKLLNSVNSTYDIILNMS